MITGLHGMFFSGATDELRAFLRDKLKLPYTDTGGGWLIFSLPAAELGCHPVDGDAPSGTHDVSFTCDDIDATVAELKGNGVTFDDAVADQGYGRAIHFTMLGGVRVELYQPHYTLDPR